ncbi:MAG TPA: hypothetical protein VFK54_06690 [Candidatus Limnocylindrales bacterium]|nr:hypothetical protein [Candidatus Limnocylindrales bacterium]
MRELLVEVLLRLVKPALATLIAVLVWAVATGPLGAAPGAELAILSWIGGACFVLLVQEGPI